MVKCLCHMDWNALGRALVDCSMDPGHAHAFHCTLDELKTNEVRKALDIHRYYWLQWIHEDMVIRWLPGDAQLSDADAYTLPWQCFLASSGIHMCGLSIAKPREVSLQSMIEKFVHSDPHNKEFAKRVWINSRLDTWG
eukprot:467365_1